MEMIRFTLRLPKELDERLMLQAKDEAISKNAVIIRACKKLVNKYSVEAYRAKEKCRVETN